MMPLKRCLIFWIFRGNIWLLASLVDPPAPGHDLWPDLLVAMSRACIANKASQIGLALLPIVCSCVANNITCRTRDAELGEFNSPEPCVPAAVKSYCFSFAPQGLTSWCTEVDGLVLPIIWEAHP